MKAHLITAAGCKPGPNPIQVTRARLFVIPRPVNCRMVA